MRLRLSSTVKKQMEKNLDSLMKSLLWEKSHGQPQMNNYQLTTYFSNIFNALYANMGNFNPLLIHVRIFFGK